MAKPKKKTLAPVIGLSLAFLQEAQGIFEHHGGVGLIEWRTDGKTRMIHAFSVGGAYLLEFNYDKPDWRKLETELKLAANKFNG